MEGMVYQREGVWKYNIYGGISIHMKKHSQEYAPPNIYSCV